MSRVAQALATGMVLVLNLNPPASAQEAPPEVEVRQAIQKGLVRVEAAARNYPEHRQCFSCHHQTMPVVAMVAAEKAGLEIDREVLDETLAFTEEDFAGRLENLRQGVAIGGRGMTVGYGLWTFWEPDRPASEATGAMVQYLLKTQEKDGRWKSNTGRPPLEGSDFTCTVLAAQGLERYATPDQRADAKEAIRKAREWLRMADAKEQEDLNAKLWGLWYGEDECAWMEAQMAVLRTQRPDGGWAQKEGMESDAYATGQTVYLLRLTGLPADDPAVVRGIRFLLRTQEEDGSWKVESRARAFQVFFDNGDPHGKSQFISTAATSWAVAALAATLDDWR